jgi:hypothetical protein
MKQLKKQRIKLIALGGQQLPKNALFLQKKHLTQSFFRFQPTFLLYVVFMKKPNKAWKK